MGEQIIQTYEEITVKLDKIFSSLSEGIMYLKQEDIFSSNDKCYKLLNKMFIILEKINKIKNSEQPKSKKNIIALTQTILENSPVKVINGEKDGIYINIESIETSIGREDIKILPYNVLINYGGRKYIIGIVRANKVSLPKWGSKESKEYNIAVLPTKILDTKEKHFIKVV